MRTQVKGRTLQFALPDFLFTLVSLPDICTYIIPQYYGGMAQNKEKVFFKTWQYEPRQKQDYYEIINSSGLQASITLKLSIILLLDYLSKPDFLSLSLNCHICTWTRATCPHKHGIRSWGPAKLANLQAETGGDLPGSFYSSESILHDLPLQSTVL